MTKISSNMETKLVEAYANSNGEAFGLPVNTERALVKRGLISHQELSSRVVDGKGHLLRSHGMVLTDEGEVVARGLVKAQRDAARAAAGLESAHGLALEVEAQRAASMAGVLRGEVVVSRVAKQGGLSELDGLEADFRLLVNGADVGGSYFCSAAYIPDGQRWASWGYAGLSMGHRTREVAERVQVDAWVGHVRAGVLLRGAGDFRMHVGVLREDARDMGVYPVTSVYAAVVNGQKEGHPAQELGGGALRVGYSWFTPVVPAAAPVSAPVLVERLVTVEGVGSLCEGDVIAPMVASMESSTGVWVVRSVGVCAGDVARLRVVTDRGVQDVRVGDSLRVRRAGALGGAGGAVGGVVALESPEGGAGAQGGAGEIVGYVRRSAGSRELLVSVDSADGEVMRARRAVVDVVRVQCGDDWAEIIYKDGRGTVGFRAVRAGEVMGDRVVVSGWPDEPVSVAGGRVALGVSGELVVLGL